MKLSRTSPGALGCTWADCAALLPDLPLRSSPVGPSHAALLPDWSLARRGQTLDFRGPRLGDCSKSGGNRGGARRLGAQTGRGRRPGVAHIRQVSHFTRHGKRVDWPDGCLPVSPKSRRSCPNRAIAGRRLLARGPRTPVRPRGGTAPAGHLHACRAQTRVGSGPPLQRARLLCQRRSPSHTPHRRRRGRCAARDGVPGTTRIDGNRNIGDSLARCATRTTEGAVTGR